MFDFFRLCFISICFITVSYTTAYNLEQEGRNSINKTNTHPLFLTQSGGHSPFGHIKRPTYLSVFGRNISFLHAVVMFAICGRSYLKNDLTNTWKRKS